MSLTEAKGPAGIALWVSETYKPPHHVEEWTMKGIAGFFAKFSYVLVIF